MASNGYSDFPMATAVPLDSVQLVEVVAPTTLGAGFSFPATYNNTIFTVTVPVGGVKQGQKLQVPFQPSIGEATPLLVTGDAAAIGVWKDGLFDCFKFGCHPSCLNACFFPQILMGQVLTRLKLDMFAKPAPDQEWRMTFKRILILVVVYALFAMIIDCSNDELDVEVEEDGEVILEEAVCAPWRQTLSNLAGLVFGLYTLIVLIRTRRAVRDKYSIPEKSCYGMEDCCCSFWCGCCTVAQLARQTADYDQTRALCCSDTGLPAPVTPALVV